MFAGLLAGALLLGACQSDTNPEQQASNPLPDGELAIEEPWVRPASPGDTAALHMTVANGRSIPDTLMGAQRAPIYEGVQLFAADEGEMRAVDSLVVPPETRTSLAPDSAYVTLTNLNQSLEEGETVLVTMDFAQSGLQQAQVSVRTSPPSDEQ